MRLIESKIILMLYNILKKIKIPKKIKTSSFSTKKIKLIKILKKNFQIKLKEENFPQKSSKALKKFHKFEKSTSTTLSKLFHHLFLIKNENLLFE